MSSIEIKQICQDHNIDIDKVMDQYDTWYGNKPDSDKFVELFGEIKVVDIIGGEGEGDHYEKIVTIANFPGKFYTFIGRYSSYSDTYYYDFQETEKLKIVIEKWVNIGDKNTYKIID